MSNHDNDEFERWQNEIKEAEAQQEWSGYESHSNNVGDDLGVADSDRPLTPPEGEEEFTDDDGTKYKWDRSLRVWVPQVGAFHLYSCYYFSIFVLNV